MKITERLIQEHKSWRGGWKRRQIEALGLEWPLHKGWIARAEGKEVTEEQFNQFIQFGLEGEP